MAALVTGAILLAAILETGLSITTDDCGVTKTCYGHPAATCFTDGSDTCYFVSWKNSDSGGTYEFELGLIDDGASYVAIALSLTSQMKDADMYYCDDQGMHSGAITARWTEPTYLELTGGLVSKSVVLQDGKLSCVLTRPRSVTKTITTGDHEFDIVANNYYLLMAKGNTKSDGILKHDWKLSTQQFNFSVSLVSSEDTTTTAATTVQAQTSAGATDHTTVATSPMTPSSGGDSQTTVTTKPPTQTTTVQQQHTTTKSETPVQTESTASATDRSTVTTSPLTQSSGGGSQTNATTKLQTQTSGDTETAAPQEYKVSREGCETTKSCYSDPADCNLGEANCRFYSWKKLDNGNFEIEMSGGTGNGEEYIAFAFGTTNLMQDADLYYCDGVTIHSAVITTRHQEPTYLNSSVGISGSSAWTVNGVAQCKLVRPQSVTKSISSGSFDFDIAERDYYLLGAQGPTRDGGIQVHTWKGIGGKYRFSSGYRVASLPSVMLVALSVMSALLSGQLSSG